MTKIWISSDYHHSHKNICKYTDRKLVTDQENHNEWLVNLHNKQVKPQDIVYLLGDISFSTNILDIKDFMNKLNGTKIIIKGNHDDSKVLNSLLDAGCIKSWHDYKEIKIGNNSTCLFHFKIANWHKQGYGAFHLFGHSHGSAEDTGGKCLDVGLDSAYNIFGEHRLFCEQDVLEYMLSREVISNDHHKVY